MASAVRPDATGSTVSWLNEQATRARRGSTTTWTPFSGRGSGGITPGLGRFRGGCSGEVHCLDGQDLLSGQDQEATGEWPPLPPVQRADQQRVPQAQILPLARRIRSERADETPEHAPPTALAARRPARARSRGRLPRGTGPARPGCPAPRPTSPPEVVAAADRAVPAPRAPRAAPGAEPRRTAGSRLSAYRPRGG